MFNLKNSSGACPCRYRPIMYGCTGRFLEKVGWGDVVFNEELKEKGVIEGGGIFIFYHLLFIFFWRKWSRYRAT